jgi:hypothetical protein
MSLANPARPAVPEPGPIELRLPVEAADAPFAYPDADGCLAVEVALTGGGYASLVLAVDQAPNWAGEVFAAISTAYREATGDPDALSEDELAALPPADVYRPGPGTHFCGEGDRPAVVRFHVVVDVEGECLDAGPLRAALVEHISERVNTTRVAVSEGFAIAGRAS